MKIADYLAREALNLAEFARRSGVPVAVLSRLADGRQNPDAATLKRLSDASGGAVGPDDFPRRADGEGGDPAAAARDFLDRNPQIRSVDLFVADTNGVYRGKRASRAEALDVIDNGLKLVGSIFALDIHGENVEETGLGMDSGDRDQIAVPVDGRIMPAPWAGPAGAQMLLTLLSEEGEPFFADPRQVLCGVERRFAELGLTPVVACELEFYLIDRERDGRGGPMPAVSPLTGRRDWSTQVLSLDEMDAHRAVLDAVEAVMTAQQVPVTGALSEYAPGQFEINVHHTAGAALACDHAVLFKRAVRAVARQHGVDATFMAKPFGNASGSGLHVHVSLVDEQGRNAFAPGYDGADERLSHAIGGLMQALPESMAVFAPNVNSFRRFQLGSYAPVAPCWGFENRTVPLRVPGGDAKARRVEHRVCGADANPYLAVAAILGAMHAGITRRIDPGPPIEGNAYEQVAPSLPRHWPTALEAYEDGVILPRYFGERFHQHYGRMRRAEFERYDAEVNPLDHAWYLDRI
ncbi:glutamine synthetase [Zavarzinia compransoris]|uniref:glutamine synthetase n=1 Tax=Zavarzinia marina TaxID=2911065 RepID=UPI001F27FC1A|nr:glutamine synthetase [Zavarzinia marina]MCF4167252.1 glutamine synthetase [Zavarzinia marina]